MTDEKLLDEMSAKIREAIGASPARDLEKNIRAMLASLFARLDLVTREEFDVQSEVLIRARQQLTRLEAQIAQLEKHIQGSADQHKE